MIRSSCLWTFFHHPIEELACYHPIIPLICVKRPIQDILMLQRAYHAKMIQMRSVPKIVWHFSKPRKVIKWHNFCLIAGNTFKFYERISEDSGGFSTHGILFLMFHRVSLSAQKTFFPLPMFIITHCLPHIKISTSFNKWKMLNWDHWYPGTMEIRSIGYHLFARCSFAHRVA